MAHEALHHKHHQPPAPWYSSVSLQPDLLLLFPLLTYSNCLSQSCFCLRAFSLADFFARNISPVIQMSSYPRGHPYVNCKSHTLPVLSNSLSPFIFSFQSISSWLFNILNILLNCLVCCRFSPLQNINSTRARMFVLYFHCSGSQSQNSTWHMEDAQ